MPTNPFAYFYQLNHLPLPTNNNVRIVQLIDSLEAGGAERMAVNYANTLADVIPFSALVTTRKEGALKQQLSAKVPYLFLNKQGKIGFKAVWKLRAFIIQNRIDFIHAHSTSFFTAILVKLFYPKIKIVWHDHYGNRAHQEGKTVKVLRFVSVLFFGVLTVNRELEVWANANLKTKKIQYFPNFITTVSSKESEKTFLKGKKGKRIVFLANLKKPKNHLQILKAFANSRAKELGWTLHLIGKDFSDAYSEELKIFIKENKLEDFIFIYGTCTDVAFILKQSNVGILGSTYEGFPVTLLEYGKAKLAVVSTNVGYCSTIVEDAENGLLFHPDNLLEITQKINHIIEDELKRLEYATIIKAQVLERYSDQAIINQYLEWLR